MREIHVGGSGEGGRWEREGREGKGWIRSWGKWRWGKTTRPPLRSEKRMGFKQLVATIYKGKGPEKDSSSSK